MAHVVKLYCNLVTFGTHYLIKDFLFVVLLPSLTHTKIESKIKIPEKGLSPLTGKWV
jgi:hypothetical protein